MAFIVVLIMTRDLKQFKNEKIDITWVKLYDGVDEKKGKLAHLIMFFFMARRFLLVTLIDESFHTYQLIFTGVLSMLWLVYLLHFKPFT